MAQVDFKQSLHAALAVSDLSSSTKSSASLRNFRVDADEESGRSRYQYEHSELAVIYVDIIIWMYWPSVHLHPSTGLLLHQLQAVGMTVPRHA